ncbi:MAG: hypothetical protein IJ679_08000 [Lachnospiraceae bacterium]|nr:hypothetical protein [Lachnospiraceae bacterium]
MSEGYAMTDYQYSSIIEMIDILLEGCSSISEAREKLARLKKNPQERNASVDKDRDKED